MFLKISRLFMKMTIYRDGGIAAGTPATNTETNVLLAFLVDVPVPA